MNRNQLLSKTYTMTANPPDPMPWDEYTEKVTAEWESLLNSESGRKERTIHRFLIEHPCYVPGAYGISSPSGHAPFKGTLLSETPLSGIGKRIPDFIWLAKNSAAFTPVLIEIESPSKQWFTKKGEPTHDLTQAINQFAQWRAWLNRPVNVGVFYDHFQISDETRRHLTFQPQFLLVYGRRQEFERRPELIRLRAQWEQEDTAVMTFDRLEPRRDSCRYIAASKQGHRYRALSAPALFQNGPNVCRLWTDIEGMAEAIASSRWISAARKKFLIKRLPYWAEWTCQPRDGMVNSGDWE